MFIGEHIVKLDSAGRVLFPSALKRQLNGREQSGFVVKRDIFEPCLVLYPMHEWERQNAILQQKLNPYNREHSKFMRMFYSGTAEMYLDANNRILLPKRLIGEVGAKKDLVFAGLDYKVEIWPLEVWKGMGVDEDFGSLAEKLLGQSDNPMDEE
ncbi:MAG: division/cell wall cluster transcriptional repressor MraZ [Bacteroidota bacterium]